MALPPLRIEIGADPSQAIAGFQSVQNEAAQTGNAVAAMSKRINSANDNMKSAGQSSRRFGSQIQNTSYQVQDFAVQLQSGTSATTALSQQLPQLLGGFGMLGAVLGGAVAVIALLVTQLDATDSALRKVAVSLGALTARTAAEAEAKLKSLISTQGDYEKQLKGLEERQAKGAQTQETELQGFAKRLRANSGLRSAEAERQKGLKEAIENQKKRIEENKNEIATTEELVKKLKEMEAAQAAAKNKGRAKDNGFKPDVGLTTEQGGESAGGQLQNDAYTIQLQNRLEQLQQFTMTEQELLASRYADRQATLTEALANELITEQQYLEQSKALHEKQAQDLANIEAAKRNTMLNTTSSLFGALANLAKQGGKKTAGIAKAFGVAEAIINTYVGATNALRTVPYPYNFVAAAAVIANGMASVASIMSVNTNGGTNAPALSTGGAAPAAAPGPLEVRLSGFGATDMFTGSQLSGLFDRLQQEAGDRGLKFIGASA